MAQAFECPKQLARSLVVPDPDDCRKYYHCLSDGRVFPMQCPNNLVFDSRQLVRSHLNYSVYWYCLCYVYFSLSLSQRSPLIFRVDFFTIVAVFLLHLFFIIFGVGLPAYLSNHNPFSREHIFVGFNEFPSLVHWCAVIHHDRPQGPTLF